MPETSYLVSAVLVSAAVTWTLRAIPFAILAPLRRSDLVSYLGAQMPLGVMGVLVVYSLRHTSVAAPGYGAPVAVALAVTVGLHLWRGNVPVSMLAGTLVHVTLASTLFAA